MTTEITVTAAHIAAGQPSAARNPLALAARDAFPGSAYVVGGVRTLYLSLDGWRVEYGLPEEAASFLAAYYDGVPVQPFTFTVTGSFRYRFRLAAAEKGRAA